MPTRPAPKLQMENEELAKHWIGLQKLPQDSEEAEALTWVLMEVGKILYESSKRSFDFILEVLNQTDDEWVLTNLAAGPLEDMLAGHPKEGIILVEKELPHNPKLKHILQDVWQNLMPEETWRRLLKLRD